MIVQVFKNALRLVGWLDPIRSDPNWTDRRCSCTIFSLVNRSCRCDFYVPLKCFFSSCVAFLLAVLLSISGAGVKDHWRQLLFLISLLESAELFTVKSPQLHKRSEPQPEPSTQSKFGLCYCKPCLVIWFRIVYCVVSLSVRLCVSIVDCRGFSEKKADADFDAAADASNDVMF